MNAPIKHPAAVQPLHPPRHHWRGGSFSVPAAETKSGCQEIHRVCSACSMIKVTCHPPHGIAYRRWIIDGEMMESDVTPRCGGG